MSHMKITQIQELLGGLNRFSIFYIKLKEIKWSAKVQFTVSGFHNDGNS